MLSEITIKYQSLQKLTLFFGWWFYFHPFQFSAFWCDLLGRIRHVKYRWHCFRHEWFSSHIAAYILVSGLISWCFEYTIATLKRKKQHLTSWSSLTCKQEQSEHVFEGNLKFGNSDDEMHSLKGLTIVSTVCSRPPWPQAMNTYTYILPVGTHSKKLCCGWQQPSFRPISSKGVRPIFVAVWAVGAFQPKGRRPLAAGWFGTQTLASHSSGITNTWKPAFFGPVQLISQNISGQSPLWNELHTFPDPSAEICETLSPHCLYNYWNNWWHNNTASLCWWPFCRDERDTRWRGDRLINGEPVLRIALFSLYVYYLTLWSDWDTWILCERSVLRPAPDGGGLVSKGGYLDRPGWFQCNH